MFKDVNRPVDVDGNSRHTCLITVLDDDSGVAFLDLRPVDHRHIAVLIARTTAALGLGAWNVPANQLGHREGCNDDGGKWLELAIWLNDVENIAMMDTTMP